MFFRYRSFDGLCNNKNHKLGAANTDYGEYLQGYRYTDGNTVSINTVPKT